MMNARINNNEHGYYGVFRQNYIGEYTFHLAEIRAVRRNDKHRYGVACGITLGSSCQHTISKLSEILMGFGLVPPDGMT